MELGSSERVLSIQSHVASGYVGGKAAVFPLQLLGYDVDVINTVHFSNHAGYGQAGGTKATSEELESVFRGLERNELMRPTRLLTGYVANADGLSAVAQLARKLRTELPEMVYLLDPVLGDEGRLYVAPDVIPLYREMLSLATIIAPNWFEVETLTNTTLTDLASLRRALKILHNEYGVPNVVVSSIPLYTKQWLLGVLPETIRPTDAEQLLCIASSASFPLPASTSAFIAPSVVHAHCIPLIRGYFSGVGDLFSALLLAHYREKHNEVSDSLAPVTTSLQNDSARIPTYSSRDSGSEIQVLEHQSPLAFATTRAIATTHRILCRTQEYVSSLPEEERPPTDDEADARTPMRRVKRMRGRELRLVQNQDVIRGVGLSVTPMKTWANFWD